MQDRFQGRAPSFDAPALDAFSITPSDVTDFAELVRAIYIGGPGQVTLKTPSGALVTFEGLSGGSVLPVRAQAVLATGTTATSLVGIV
ncbi:spike base protein, RCAP_Rcc01079 family [Maritalea porphyrae]|uniref:Uncharacterized protein n=1 Tax=Maritalea porphyrae TaxID=880732 RepID=A0ABQ5URH4_9HYPH|nr:hypothetical protein [Maritalea porphyrae]GLQ17876.1 hypothetical protein GCM10007879_21250 [Maritalea porphyrae]